MAACEGLRCQPEVEAVEKDKGTGTECVEKAAIFLSEIVQDESNAAHEGFAVAHSEPKLISFGLILISFGADFEKVRLTFSKSSLDFAKTSLACAEFSLTCT